MMSKEIVIPQGVTVEIYGNKVKTSGTKGQVERQFQLEKDMKIEMADGKVKVSSEGDRRSSKALIGTLIAHIKNMMTGVTQGFTYKLRSVSAHFPMTVKVEGSRVTIANFLGERTPRIANIISGVQVKIEGQDLTVTGIDLEKVSQTAANIELATRIVGYDKRIFQDGVYIVSKGE
ncbi:50S ribosomal protein L6 [archaeon]|nr:MAG: 50S ribosomal protein L6 [archaeon]